MAAITPTVQKVTNGLRGIVKSIIENRKTKARHADTAADESLEANASIEANPQTETPSRSRKAQSRSSSQRKVSAKSNQGSTHQSRKRPTRAANKNKKSAHKVNAKKATAQASHSKARPAASRTETVAAPVTSVIPGVDQDPAHKPGHQKMNLKAQFSEKTGKKGKSQNSKALNYLSGADRVQRTTSPHRRIIHGAGTLGAKAPQGRSRKAH